MAKVSKQEYQEQLDRLKEWLPPGSTLYTILEHVSRSGMQRTIRVVLPTIEGTTVESADPQTRKAGDYIRRDSLRAEFLHPNHAVSVITGYTRDNGRGREGVKIGGCGMDMGFALVNHVSEKLYGGKRCDCGAWYDDSRPGQRFTREDFDARTDRSDAEVDRWHYRYLPDCPKCKGSGNVIGTGYPCLGKGKCPSNYHTNHRDHLHCDGVNGNRCYKPDRFSSRYPVPEGWPEIELPIGGGESISVPAACLLDAERDTPIGICPTCKGLGTVPNPEGPERFDLEHFDGYAIRHRWL